MGNTLHNKAAIVTGAGRGIGAATARLLAAHGARVVLASRNPAEVAGLAAAIDTELGPGRCLACPTDVSQEAQVVALFDACTAQFGSVDIVVNNAAIIEVKDFMDMDLPTWKSIMDININGVFLCSREAFRRMSAGGNGGAIVNIGSLSGVRGPEKFKGFSSYVVSKYGVLGLTDILAVEGRPHGIRVNCVSPGAVETAMLKKAAPFLNTTTLPEDVAKAIYFLADDTQSAHITGANLEIFSNG